MASRLVPLALEDRQGIERRPGSLLNSERRRHEEELVTIEPPRLLGCALEVEVVENADAHGCQRKLMKSYALRET